MLCGSLPTARAGRITLTTTQHPHEAMWVKCLVQHTTTDSVGVGFEQPSLWILDILLYFLGQSQPKYVH